MQSVDDEFVLQNTRDGGANWTTITEVPWQGELYFPNDSTGYAIVRGDETNVLYQTLDGGVTWDAIDAQLTDEPVMQLADGGRARIFPLRIKWADFPGCLLSAKCGPQRLRWF